MVQHSNIEEVLFSFSTYVKCFHQHLINKYHLTDIPYNVKGREFPKVGVEDIDGISVEYQFHGRGCTLKWEGTEVKYDIDACILANPSLFNSQITGFKKSHNENERFYCEIN